MRALLGRVLVALGVACGSEVAEVPGARLAGVAEEGELLNASRYDRAPHRNDTLLGRAALRIPAFAGSGSEAVAAAAAECLRGGAARDLAPLRHRVERALGPQAARDCLRGAEHFYCEALLDVVDPWPLDSAPECAEPAPLPENVEMRMEVERGMALCYVVFMVAETEAVQSLLDFRGPEDVAVVHVDASQPQAFEEMQNWAQDQKGVKVISRWKVMRAGYSAGTSLLDALEVAAQMPQPWEVALFLSGSHFWMRPRSEMVRFLRYHRGNFAAMAEDAEGIDRRFFVASHYEPHFECGGHLWKVARDLRDQSTVLLPHFGHPNLTAVTGQPFVVLRREFVDWVIDGRRVQGSPVWTVLRYTLRMGASVEKMFGCLLLTLPPWCHQTTVFHDMTFARVLASEQQVHHNPNREGTEDTILSAGYLRVKDLREIRVARWHVMTQILGPHGADGGPPPGPPSATGIYRTTSEAERNAMDCENCFHSLVSFHWSDCTPAYVAFARKVDTPLRMALSARDALEPRPVWEPSDWPLAARIWELWAFACSRDRIVSAQRRVCDPRDESMPCTAEFRIASAAPAAPPGGGGAARPSAADGSCECPPSITVRERVAVGTGRVLAAQVGSQWNSDARNFAEPSIVRASAPQLEVVYFPTVMRPHDLRDLLEVSVVLEPPPDAVADALVSEKVDIRTIIKRAVVTFPLTPHLASLSVGEWSADVEVQAEPPQTLARRYFHAYHSLGELTRAVILQYFEVSVGECGG